VVDEVKHFKRDRLKSFEEDSPIFFEKPSQVFCSNMPEDTEFLSDSDKNNEITPPEEKLGSASENLFPSTGWAETASGLPEKTLADLQEKDYAFWKIIHHHKYWKFFFPNLFLQEFLFCLTNSCELLTVIF
jgi:hypothetical protein